jgi:hypothetical protein
VGGVPGVHLGLQAVALGQQGGVLGRQVGTMASKPAQKAAGSTPVPGSTVVDRSFEQQRYRASGLNLITAAIVLWNTVYLERAVNALRGHAKPVDDALLQYLSPLGWEHINLTGDYLWKSSAKVGAGKFRPLRPMPPA